MSESWLVPEAPSEEQDGAPNWLVEQDPVQEPDAEVTVQPFVPPSDKQERIKKTVEGLKAQQRDKIKAAEAYRLSREEGLPMDIAYRQADKLTSRRKDVPKFDPAAPASQSFAYQPDRLGMLDQDDVDKMGAIEKAWTQLSIYRTQNTEGLESADIGSRMLFGTATKQDETRLNEIRAQQSMRPEITDSNVIYGAGVIDQAIKSTGQSFIRAWDEVAVGAGLGAVTFGTIGGTTGTVVLPGFGTATGAAGGAALGAVAGGVTGLKVGMASDAFQQVSGQVYLDAREMLDENGNKIDDDLAKGVAIFTGVMGGGLELVSLKLLKDSIPGLDNLLTKKGVTELVAKAQGNSAIRASLIALAKAAAGEGLQEVGEQVSQVLSSMAVGGEYDANGEKLSAQLSPEELAKTFGWGAVGGAGISVGLQAGTKAVTSTYNFARSRVEAKRQTLVQLGDVIRKTGLSQRSPEAFAEYAAELDKAGESQMTAPAEALSKLFQDAGLSADQISQSFPELAQHMSDAAESGSEVPISAQTFVKLAGLEGYDEFTKDIRTAPEEMTAREAEVETQGFEEMLASMSEQDREKAVVASLEEELTTALVESGQMDPANARKSAKIAIAGQLNLARRAGVSVEQLAERYKLKIQSGMTAGPDAMVKANDTTEADARQEGRTIALYTVATEDSGDLPIRFMRHADGSVTLFDDTGETPPREYNKDFAADKTDEEILQWSYEPLGFTGATKTEKLQQGDATATDAMELGVDPVELAAQVRAAGGDITQTPAFQQWFGDSKVVDAEGRPLVQYHGTTSTAIDVFWNMTHFGTSVAAEERLSPTRNFDRSRFETPGMGRASFPENLMPVYLSINNPLDVGQEAGSVGTWETQSDMLEQVAGALEYQAGVTPDITDEIRRIADELRDGEETMRDEVKNDLMSKAADLIEQAGYDGIVYTNMIEDAGKRSYIPLRPTQIKSVFNRGTFDPNEPNILFQRAQPRMQEGGTKPPQKAANRASLEQMFKFVGKKVYQTGRDLKLEIQDLVRKAAGGVDLSIQNEANQQHLIKVGIKDALFALKSNANAVGWYDKTVRKATKVLAKIHPEIETDRNSRFAFMWALAATSNGMKVDANFRLAERVYRYWKTNGRMPTDKDAYTSGTAAEAMLKSYVDFNNLIDRLGYDDAIAAMTTRFTVKQLNAMDIKVNGEDSDIIVRGAAHIGPKIGNGFFSNLYGFFDALTIDRWAMRTWGRWIGKLVEVNEEAVARNGVALSALIQGLSPDAKAEIEGLIGVSLDQDVNDIAVAIKKASVSKETRESLNAVGLPTTGKNGNPSTQGNDLRKLGNNLAGLLDGQIEMPEQSQRQYIRDTFSGILTHLQKNGYPELTMSDLQALLWYPEKRLYDAAKSKDEAEQGYDDDEAPDYANAAVGLARELQVPEADIQQALKEAENETGRRPQAAGVGGGVLGGARDVPGSAAAARSGADAVSANVQSADPAGTAQRDRAERTQRNRLLKRYIFQRDRHRRKLDGGARAFKRKSYRTPRGMGQGILAKFTPTGAFKKTLNLSDLKTPDAIVELAPGTKSVDLFHKSIKASKRRSKYGAAVYVYPKKTTAEETGYDNMRLFLTEDGRNGFALKPDGDIVSVFSEGGGMVHSMLELAIEEGGTKLDAFNTVLPKLYRFGDFVEVGRAPWDDAQKPEGWDYETFKDYNDGRPDVVFMEYRPDENPFAEDNNDGRQTFFQEADAGDGRGRPAGRGLAPLEGAPTVRGVSGPIEGLVNVAEQYARDNGIQYTRQAEYVSADPERGARIAEAYAAMPHAPNDPTVREAYQNLIDQTVAQYEALANAGYSFYFIDLSTPEGEQYASTPWNAIFDLRDNKTMGVFSTVDGFGTDEDFSPDANPMLQDTGLQWPMGPGGELRPVLANDLFRAVHDAFGHGLEGAGFRADGEENAWQAHVRLFTGSAVAAITTETRGQNSWLNFGPYGETNRTAQVEDTVFADQKTGLMPEWTWTEGRAADETTRLEQSSEPVFYSALLRGVESSQQPKAPPAQWMGLIKNMLGVKQEEIEWLGVEEWLKSQDGSVTREDLADYIRANQVQIEEVVLGGEGTLSREERRPISERLDELNSQKMIIDDLAAEGTVEAMDSPQLVDAVRFFQPNAAVSVEMIVTDPTMKESMQDFVRLSAIKKQREMQLEISQLKQQLRGPTPRHEFHYRLPGGENYREIVLTMPGQIEPYVPDQMHFTSEGGGTAIGWARVDDRTGPNGERILHIDEIQTKRHQDALKRGYAKKQRELAIPEIDALQFQEALTEIDALEQAYNVAYEKRDPNAEDLWVASAKKTLELQDRVSEQLPENYRVQQTSSGWALIFSRDWQSGGLQVEQAPSLPDLLALIAGKDYSNDELASRDGRVPDAPFKTTWDELLLKRMIRYAVDNGYDSITWPSGEIVADRYSMRNQIDSIAWSPQGADVNMGDATIVRLMPAQRGSTPISLEVGPDGIIKSTRNAPGGMEGQELGAVIGEGLAKRIMEGGPSGSLEGESLQVGGDFLINLYNKRIPRFLNKLTKKMGGKVETTNIGGGGQRSMSGEEAMDIAAPETRDMTSEERSNWFRALDPEDRDELFNKARRMIDTVEVWSLPITDEMRAAVSQGLPMFQGGQEPRGFIEFTKARDIFTITLTGNANLSTFLHETGHYFLEVMTDLVETGQGNIRMQEDLKTLREWAGVGPDGKFQREHHEKFARAFEAYLMEGVAPSVGLRGLFNRFKGWLTFIYKNIASLNVNLTDEVRGVMDRLLASDEEIARAKRDAGHSPAPMGQEEMGLTDSEYEQYLKLWEASEEAARAEVDARQMKDFQLGQSDAFKQEVQRNIEAMTKELEKTRGFQVWMDLQERDLKLDRESLTPEQRKLAFGLFSTPGIDADAYAEAKGYSNALDMLNDIAQTKQKRSAIPAEAKAMAEKAHGMMGQPDLEKAAEIAVHNAQQQELLLMEYMALTSRDGRKARKGFMQWVNQTARDRVGSLTRRQLDPSRWRRAELKAANEAGAATARGDTATAALAKRRQLMAGAMYRASLEADQRFEKLRNYLVPFAGNKRRQQLGWAGDMYLDPIDEILEGISFKRISAKQVARQNTLADLLVLAEQNGEMLDVPEKLRNQVFKKDWQSMTLDELEAVRDTVANIWKLAKKKNELRANKERRTLEQFNRELALAAENAVPAPELKDKFNKTVREQLKSWKDWGVAALMKPELIFSILDGVDAGGLSHRFVFQPFVDAQNNAYKWYKRYSETIYKRLASMPKDQASRWKAKITFLGDDTATGETVIAAALNLGNDVNRKRLFDGEARRGFTPEQILSEINNWMTKEDWDLVQHIWDEVNMLWPELERVARVEAGIPLEKQPATPVETPYGTYQGGYYPIKYDPARSKTGQKADEKTKELFGNPMTFNPVVTAGAKNARISEVKDSPLLLNLSVLTRHLSETIHYVTHYEAVNQANKVLRSRDFQNTVTRHLGKEYNDVLRQWLLDISRNQDAPDVGIGGSIGSNFFRNLRVGGSYAGLGLNLFTAFKQPLGLMTNFDALPAKYVLRGFADMYLRPLTFRRSAWRFATENSKELEELVKGYDRDVKLANRLFRENINKRWYRKFQEAAFLPMGYMQGMVNVATWMGGYHKAMDDGLTHDEAVNYADAIVRQTQSSGALKDLSAVQRGDEATRVITMFYSWLNLLFARTNRQLRENKAAGRLRSSPKLIAHLFWVYVATTMIEEAGRRMWEGLTGEEEDDEDVGYLLSVLLKSGDLMIATVPVLRNFVQLGGDYGLSLTPIERPIKDIDATINALQDLVSEGEIPTAAELKKANRAFSVITKTPTAGVWTSIEEAMKIKEQLD